MNESIKREQFMQAAERVTGWRRPLLVSHAKPDGDALGSLLALQSLLRSNGVDPLALLFDDWPARYDPLRELGELVILGKTVDESDLAAVDGVIMLDTCSYSQLAPLEDWLRASDKPKLAVDHHQTRDPVADDFLVDTAAAANCVILFEWARAAGWAIDSAVASALFVGVASDTGWFRHSNTDARTLSIAAELSALGVEPHVWFERLYQRETPARLRLRAEALASMELLADGRLAILTLPLSAFERAGATAADTEDIINEPLQIGAVKVSILLVEQSDGVVRASFRSKPASTASQADFDVAAFAQRFGGGGHRRAAGARIEGSLADVVERVVKEFDDAVQA